jgi:two-component system, NtrC family, sensor kinase
MQKSILVVFLTCLIISHGAAQPSLPRAYEIKMDTAAAQSLDSINWQILEDKAASLTIGQVSSLAFSDRFHYAGNRLTNTDTTATIFWFRYRLKNDLDSAVHLALDSKGGQDDFYVFQTRDTPRHFVTGYLYPWDKKDGFKLANCIPLVLKPGQEILVYDRAYSRPNRIRRLTPVDFANTQKEINREFDQYNGPKEDYFDITELMEAFIIGMLFIAIVSNWSFYRIVREKVFLYFSLFLLFLLINRFYNITSSYLFYVHPFALRYVHYLGYAWVFILVFLIQFVRYFFQTFITYPKWDKILVFFGLLNILVGLVRFVSDFFLIHVASIVFYIDDSIFASTQLVLLVTLILFVRRPGRFGKLVILGAFPLLFFYFFTGLFMSDNVYSIFTESNFSHWLQSNFRFFELLCLIWLVLLFSRVLFMRFDELRKKTAQQALEKERLEKEKEMERNLLIAQQKIDLENQVTERTLELKQSIEGLKSAQAQLIQSEKMASLGELTAGIAHEIQNPLNFVNNFSEVNAELLSEMKEEISQSNFEQASSIADHVIENEQKINHHGKRADAIVKSMLQHSRISTGNQEPTDINSMADEYLRLSYHGLRAKDKSFNATMQTDFDSTLGKVNIIPNEMSRVLLNLYNNAFYAVSEKAKRQIPGYVPTVSVSTRKMGDTLKIIVQDNGDGIPPKVLDKIFQPFFTTKPSGQGTGLGLSLSYDIVKVHGGEIRVETKELEGSRFVIELPV